MADHCLLASCTLLPEFLTHLEDSPLGYQYEGCREHFQGLMALPSHSEVLASANPPANRVLFLVEDRGSVSVWPRSGSSQV